MGWLPVPSYFNAPINPEDRVLASDLRQKVIPWSKTPFDPVQENPNFDEKTLPVEEPEEEEELEGVEPVPEWLELFFDLAWTVTFSSLSSNSPIKGAMTVVSFFVFFTLAWWLWVAQTLYDTKFYVNDAWHRFFLLLQFVIFGALAAFTNGFDVTVGFAAPPAASDATDEASNEYVLRAFQAIGIVFFTTRLLLAIEYVRVIRYAKNRNLTSMYIIVGTLCASALLFLGSFFVVRADPHSKTNNVIKFVMWGLAILLEVLAYCQSTMPRGLLTKGSMPERLSTLSTVVIGEGLNGFIDPITAAAKSVGFGARVAGQIIICGLIVFLVFIIYFQSFRARQAPSSVRQKFVVLAHFPVQLFIILLFEGLKSILNILTLENSLNFFLNVILANPNGFNASDPDVISAYRKLGIDLPSLNVKLDGYVGNITSDLLDFDDPDVIDAGLTLDDFKITERNIRDLAAAVQALFTNFNANDDSTQLNDYVNSFSANNQAVNDTLDLYINPNSTDPFPLLEKMLDDSANARLQPAMWVAPVAGFLLLAVAFIMIVNGLARNRYAWWSFVARIIMGVSLCLIGLLDISSNALSNWVENWLLPTIAIAYAILYVVDYGIAVLQARALQMSKREFERAQLRADASGLPVEHYARATSSAARTSGVKLHDSGSGSTQSLPRQRA